jgi:hypothetical protein
MNSIKIKVFLRPLIISVVICFTTLPRSELTSSMVELATYDTFGRLTYFPNKRQIDCPRQTTSTGVLLVVGQSNSANHAHKIYQTQYPERVINYFNGKCFIGSSPLLGATGPNGNFITLLADNLILNSTFKTVVIVASGVSGSPISRWKFGGDLNRMLIATLSEAGSRYSITDIVW